MQYGASIFRFSQRVAIEAQEAQHGPTFFKISRFKTAIDCSGSRSDKDGTGRVANQARDIEHKRHKQHKLFNNKFEFRKIESQLSFPLGQSVSFLALNFRVNRREHMSSLFRKQSSTSGTDDVASEVVIDGVIIKAVKSERKGCRVIFFHRFLCFSLMT